MLEVSTVGRSLFEFFTPQFSLFGFAELRVVFLDHLFAGVAAIADYVERYALSSQIGDVSMAECDWGFTVRAFRGVVDRFHSFAGVLITPFWAVFSDHTWPTPLVDVFLHGGR